MRLRGPLARHLALGVGADVGGGGLDGGAEVRRQSLARGAQFGLRHADALALEAIELARVFDEGAIAALTDGVENGPHHGLGFGESGRLARQQAADLFAFEYADHSTILLSGYSTIPSPPACFKRGMMSRTVVSSRMVLTASHSSSLRCEMVGRLRAGQHGEHGRQMVLVHVEHEADFAEGVDGAIEQHADIFQFAALLRVFPGCLVGDQLGVGFQHGIDDLEIVGAQDWSRSR